MFLALLLTLACGGSSTEEPAAEPQTTSSSPAETPVVEPPGPSPLPTAALSEAERAKFRACSTDADCTAIDIDCCNLCNGGTAMPLNKAFVDEARKRLLEPKDCSAVSCTDAPCEMPATTCHESVCSFSMAVNKPKPLPMTSP